MISLVVLGLIDSLGWYEFISFFFIPILDSRLNLQTI